MMSQRNFIPETWAQWYKKRMKWRELFNPLILFHLHNCFKVSHDDRRLHMILLQRIMMYSLSRHYFIFQRPKLKMKYEERKERKKKKYSNSWIIRVFFIIQQNSLWRVIINCCCENKSKYINIVWRCLLQ